MKDHIEQDQLHKIGLRYFFPAGDNTDIAQRVEWGVPFKPPVPSYQLDRGRFENELGKRNLEAGVDLRGGCREQSVELGPDGHTVTFTHGDEEQTIGAKWVVDAAGRAFILKRHLDLLEDNDHDCNSAWFRLAGGIDVESWVPESDDEWFAPMTERGLRKLSTNHLCGQGYWVWLIPLSSGAISIGIVAEERYHPMEEMDTFDKALDWLRRHEPQLAAEVEGRQRRRRGLPQGEGLLVRLQAGVLGRGPLVPDGRGGRVPRPLLFTGVGLHRDVEHVRDRPGHARPRRRGRHASARSSTTTSTCRSTRPRRSGTRASTSSGATRR